MRFLLLTCFSTLVLVSAYCLGSEGPTAPLRDKDLDERNTFESPYSDQRPYLNISQPSDLKLSEPEAEEKKKYHLKSQNEVFYFDYESSLSPKLGALISSESTVSAALALNYMFSWKYDLFWELGAFVGTSGEGEISFAPKFVLDQNKRLRPFAKFGLAVRPDGRQGLATFFNISNYALRASTGIEDLIWTSTSLRMELEGSVSANEIRVIIWVGPSWVY